MARPERHSGTSKASRFNYEDYHMWYQLKYDHGLSASTIAKKFECSEQHVQKTVKRMHREGYADV